MEKNLNLFLKDLFMKKIYSALIFLIIVFVFLSNAQPVWETSQRLTWNRDVYDIQVAAYWKYVHVVWSDEQSGNDIFYKRSYDYGATWEPVKRLTWGGNKSGILDLAVNGSNIHLVFFAADNTIVYKRSTDNGESWIQKKLTWGENYPIDLAVAVSGNIVHVVYFLYPFYKINPGIYHSRSLDNGETWEPKKWIDYSLYNSLDLDCSGWNVHMVFSAEMFHEGHLDLFYIHSSNAGTDWDLPHQIAQSGNIIQYDSPGFTPWAAVASSGQNVHIVYPDNRKDRDTFMLFNSNSTDSGQTWELPKILTYYSQWNDDIIIPGGLACQGSSVFAAYFIDGIYNSDIFFKQSGDSGVSWSPPTRLTWNQSASDPRLCHTPAAGYIHIVYRDQDDVYYKRGKL